MMYRISGYYAIEEHYPHAVFCLDGHPDKGIVVSDSDERFGYAPLTVADFRAAGAMGLLRYDSDPCFDDEKVLSSDLIDSVLSKLHAECDRQEADYKNEGGAA